VLACVLLSIPGISCAEGRKLSATACEHIHELVADKDSRTPAQRKLSSDLLLHIQAERCRANGYAVPELRSEIELDENKSALVDIEGKVSEDLLKKIEELHGVVINSFPKYEKLRARVPILELEKLAESSEIRSIRAADKYQLHGTDSQKGD